MQPTNRRREREKQTQKIERVEVIKQTPFINDTKDIPRTEAQRRAWVIFGPRAFCRKHTNTEPGMRFQIGLRSRVGGCVVEVLGSGNSWMEATRAALVEWEKRGLK